MKRGLIVLSCLAAFLALPAMALAGTVTLFEKVYVKPVGKPVTYTDTFSLGPNTGNYRLVVRNGADGSNEVQNVYVWVNGVQAFGHRDFKKDVNSVEMEVALSDFNSLTIALQGQGSTFITVEIVGEETATTPPPFDPGQIIYW
jgi:hypothetical protein